MKYKPGDKVRIKSFDWYIANECGGLIMCDGITFHERMIKLCGKELTIDLVYTNDEGTSLYIMKEPETQWRFTDSMIEGLVEEKPQETMVSLDKVCSWIDDVDISKYLSCIFSGAVNISFKSNDFIRDLKKSMEE
jgi:hypothetical protein